jgi:hypothetical protein
MAEPATQPLPLAPEECLRVLFVFAEARGSQPLAARQERQELQQLFREEIYRQNRIEADFLTHGVTRPRLEEQLRDRGGYHIVHWSGHGHLNLLELAKPGGDQDLLSGQDLLDLFIRAGGFIPRLFFLSACHSGDILQVQNWEDFLAVAQGQEPGARETPGPGARDIPLAEQPGYTGTAHALLQGGVPSVVAMRYAVGDDYARDLAVEFTGPCWPTPAEDRGRGPDHGPERPPRCRGTRPLVLRGLRSRHPGALRRRAPRPDLAAGPQPGAHRAPSPLAPDRRIDRARAFRGAHLGTGRYGRGFHRPRAGGGVKPVALITGLGGMGKTALAAEALALWESRFDWVLLYQAKPNPLGFEAFLHDLHLKLSGELGRYHDHVQAHRADAIFRPADEGFTGPARLARLTDNLVRALQDEAILLVLDNFETNLKPQAEPGAGEPVWACQDPAWDRCLSLLATELAGAPSRVLITCRRPLAALAGTPCHRVPLGPLPPGEAALYLRQHPALRPMVFWRPGRGTGPGPAFA